jgi:hypothetical protein
MMKISLESFAEYSNLEYDLLQIAVDPGLNLKQKLFSAEKFIKFMTI